MATLAFYECKDIVQVARLLGHKSIKTTEGYIRKPFEDLNRELLKNIAIPVAPVAPVAPVTPVAPVIHVTPVAPVIHVTPVAPSDRVLRYRSVKMTEMHTN
jgi:hypothetical protein